MQKRVTGIAAGVTPGLVIGLGVVLADAGVEAAWTFSQSLNMLGPSRKRCQMILVSNLYNNCGTGGSV
jgi:hypothetical protein